MTYVIDETAVDVPEKPKLLELTHKQILALTPEQSQKLNDNQYANVGDALVAWLSTLRAFSETKTRKNGAKQKGSRYTYAVGMNQLAKLGILDLRQTVAELERADHLAAESAIMAHDQWRHATQRNRRACYRAFVNHVA